MPTTLEIVSAYQDAWTAGDFERARQHLTADAVFHSSGQHIEGADGIIPMLTAFGSRIGNGWELISATDDGDRVVVLYNLFMPDGSPALCSDYFSLHDGKIDYELLTFDPKPFEAAAQRTAPHQAED